MKTIELDTDKVVIKKKPRVVKTPVVTRHKALLAYLLDKEIIKEGEFELIEHAEYKDVMGKNVIGVLPLQLSAYSKTITEVPLTLTPEMRGKELTLNEVEQVAGDPVKYIVREVDSIDGVDYYSEILEGYTDEEYALAHKYYEHVSLAKKYFKNFEEIAKARTIYMDIMNCLYGIFDIYTIENRGWREFDFMKMSGLRFRCSVIYADETFDTQSVQMESFDKASIRKFISELIHMCL